MKAPREFWISEFLRGLGRPFVQVFYEKIEDDKATITHVIEKSAYDQVASQRAALAEQVQELQKESVNDQQTILDLIKDQKYILGIVEKAGFDIDGSKPVSEAILRYVKYLETEPKELNEELKNLERELEQAKQENEKLREEIKWRTEEMTSEVNKGHRLNQEITRKGQELLDQQAENERLREESLHWQTKYKAAAIEVCEVHTEAIAQLREMLKQAECKHSWDATGACELCGLGMPEELERG